MTDHENLVVFVERALLLKTLPVLSDAGADEIAAIANRLEDRSFMPGATLFRAGEVPTALHVLFEGRARVELPGGPIARKSGEVVGLLDALDQRPYAGSCVCETAVHTVALRIDDLFDLLEDFSDLSRALIAFLARHVRARVDEPLRRAHLDVEGAAFSGRGSGRGEPLDLMEKIVFMKGMPLFGGASADELARLGKEVAEVAWAPGDVVARDGDRADAFHLVVHGRLGTRGPRSAVGLLDVLQQGAFTQTLVAMEPTRALCVPAERFF
ncbi:MAG TPA: cyclic nucleotide-binding domain-containing protein, partial [Ideonella sp.]|nr:cyclic nucleotide-binding domain-containing protein [Ideonella sp.]